MQWNLDAVGSEGAPIEHSWTSDDTLRYALGVGAGVVDPFGAELDLTTENTSGHPQRVLPTFGVVIDAKGSAFGLAGSFDPTKAAPYFETAWRKSYPGELYVENPQQLDTFTASLLSAVTEPQAAS